MATVTATPNPATGTVLVQVEQTQLRDLYTRVVANGWGNATTGQAWALGGGVAAEYAVNGTQGTMTFSATGSSRRMSTSLGGIADMGFQIQCTVAVLALTQPIQPGIMIRHTDGANYYMAELSILPSNAVELRIRKMVLNVTTTIDGAVTLDQVHAAGATWNIKADICGSTIRAKAWRSTVTEPDWMITVNDFDLTTGPNVGVRSILATGNTNGSTVFAYDNAVAYIGDSLKLTRVTPDGVETEVQGSPFGTNAPTAAAASATATLWDPSAPFDVNIFYRLYSGCSALAVTSATTLLDSGGFGWLRDPLDPTRNFAIAIDGFFDDCIDQDVILFSGLGGPSYDNASGVFDKINSARPNTISQRRKNHASSLNLTSFSLDDILDLEDILADGRILSLTLPVEYGWAQRTYGTDWITIFDVQQSYLGVDQRVTARAWSLPFRLSTPPQNLGGGDGGNGVGGGGATYDDLAASVIGLTYNSLTASGFTYDQIAAGTGY